MDIDLDIDTLTIGGRGLGRHDGKAVFVAGTAPGDRVRCRVVRSRKHFDEAEPVELLRPSPVRRPSPCPVFGSCGGCQWQHLPYPEQRFWKEKLFHDLLLRAGVASGEALRPIVTAPEEWGYRNRVQFKCRLTREGFVSGFYRQGSHFVTDTNDCLLAMPEIRKVYSFLRGELPESPCPEAIPQVDISCGDDRLVTVLVHVLPIAADAVRAWLPAVAGRGGFAAALQVGRKETIEILSGEPRLATTVDQPVLNLSTSPGGFSQVNPDQNRALVKAVLAAAALDGCERILDLYCGVGNFTLPLARRAAAAVGVENYAPAIADAAANASRHAIGNAVFFAESAEGALRRHGPFDLVLLDPPRTGAYPVMREFLAARPRRILYISCDPVTLSRDLTPLVHGGYRVVSSQPFDFFPQTWHMESLTVLVAA